jgi:hypothetical protein
VACAEPHPYVLTKQGHLCKHWAGQMQPSAADAACRTAVAAFITPCLLLLLPVSSPLCTPVVCICLITWALQGEGLVSANQTLLACKQPRFTLS